MQRSCPDCAIPLEQKNNGGVVVDACPRCAGIFFDEGEIAAIKMKSNSSLSELDEAVTPQESADAFKDEKVRICPACGVGMSTYRYLYSSPIVLDSCDKCGGMWVENGELKAMAEYARSEATLDSPMAVVAQMKVATEENINRAKIAERTMRMLALRLRGGRP